MNGIVKCMFILLLSVLSITASRAQDAPQPPIERLIIRQTATEAQLLNLHADGSTTFITSLEGIYFDDWNVPAPVDTATSPQGEHVAFTARDYDKRATLFLVSLNPLRVKQFDAPGLADLAWSPAGDALLLIRPTTYLGGESGAIPVGNVYVFDLATELFTLVAENTSQGFHGEGNLWAPNAVWSPNGERIILNFDDLYTVRRDGTDQQQLTNLKVQAPQSIDFDQPSKRNTCSILDMQWSASMGRIYYAVDCYVYSEVAMISLFSVNLLGENRLEVDLFEQFPDEFAVPYSIGHSLIGIFMGQNHVFLVLNSPSFNIVVVGVDAFGEVDVVTHIPSKEVRLAAISENGTKMGISMAGGEVAVMDLTTNDVTTLSPTDTPLVPCQVQWLNDETILINQVHSCRTSNAAYPMPLKTIAWTPSTGAIQNVTEITNEDFNLILPISRVPDSYTGLNEPPIANAGVDQTVTTINGRGFADVTLGGSASTDNDGEIADYQWYKNGELVASGATPVVSLAVGANLLVLRVTDNLGLTGIDFVNIEVLPLGTPTPTD